MGLQKSWTWLKWLSTHARTHRDFRKAHITDPRKTFLLAEEADKWINLEFHVILQLVIIVFSSMREKEQVRQGNWHNFMLWVEYWSPLRMLGMGFQSWEPPWGGLSSLQTFTKAAGAVMAAVGQGGVEADRKLLREQLQRHFQRHWEARSCETVAWTQKECLRAVTLPWFTLITLPFPRRNHSTAASSSASRFEDDG